MNLDPSPQNPFPWISPHLPAIVLAPMEGVMDAAMRAFLTERGGLSFCVSEFIRVSQEVVNEKVFCRDVPEFQTHCLTPSGIPVQIQLLGGNEERMAASALVACRLGAGAIDINFGCPSPLVNRNDGGASLLRSPTRIRSIVAAVRSAVPSHIPVSAKLRLGWDSIDDIFVNAEQAALGGANWITIHARTKTQGYAPPVYWKRIGEVRQRLGTLPVVANGDIWTREGFLRCQEESGCQHFMIGRGALSDPTLLHEIARQLRLPVSSSKVVRIAHETAESSYPFSQRPEDWRPILERFCEISEPVALGSAYTARRVKQWLKMAHLRMPLPWFDTIKRADDLAELFRILNLVSETDRTTVDPKLTQ